MGLFSRADLCEGCDAELPQEARFCPQCARPAAFVQRVCGRQGCDGIAGPYDEFCPRCGAGLPRVEGETSFDVLWSQPPGELARRFRMDTEKQAVDGGVTVRFGHRALLLGDGALLKTFEPGHHPVQTTIRDLQIGNRGPRRFEAIQFDTGEQTLDYSFAGFPSADGIPCLADLRLAVEIREPERLLTAFMKNAENATVEGLRLRVRDEVRNAVEEALATWPAIEIAGDRRRKDELAGRVGDHMRRTLEALGFALNRVETLDVRAVALDDVRVRRVERAVGREDELESVAQIQQDAEIHQRKAAAWAALRDSVQRAEMDEVTDKTSLRDFMRRMNREAAEKDRIAESELDAVVASLAYQKEDRERARAFVLLRLDEEQGFELDRLAAKRRLADLETEIQAAKQEAIVQRERTSGEVAVEDLKAESEARSQRRREMFGLDVLERRMGLEQKAFAENLRLKSEVYKENKRAKAEAAALKLKAAGEAGLGADQIAALFAEEQPELAAVLRSAFQGRSAQELKGIYEAVQNRDAATIQNLIERLGGALGGTVEARAEAGDQVARAIGDTVGMMRNEGRGSLRKRCRVCHSEWFSESRKCPSCGEAAS